MAAAEREASDTRMKAIVQEAYGGLEVLSLGKIAKPTVGDSEVLVRVHAASVHPDIWHVMRGRPYLLRTMGAGLRKPKNPVAGTDMAGLVEAVGSKVQQFRPGDAVFGETARHPWENGGAYAEYVSVPAKALARKPDHLTFEEAAAMPTSAFITLRNLRGVRHVEGRQKVLVNGAGGGVGTFAVQFAKSFGAEVTAVDSPKKLDMLRSIGADHVIDYTSEDFTRHGERYDLILDIATNKSFSDCRRALTADGTYVLIGHEHFGKSSGRWLGILRPVLALLPLRPFVRQLPSLRAAKDAKPPLVLLRELLEAGTVTPVVDRTYPLSELHEAIRYLARGDALGKVVVTITPNHQEG